MSYQVLSSPFEDAFSRDLAYTVTTDFKSSGISQINFLLLRLANGKNSHALIKKLRFGNKSGQRSILRVYSTPVVGPGGPGVGLVERNRLINKANSRPSDLLANKNDGTMDVTNRGELLNIFVGHQLGQTIEVPLELRLEKPESGLSMLLFTIQNSLAATSTHIDVDWIETPIL